MPTDQSPCRRCGSCCREGGPALHLEDLALLKEGHIRHTDLITVRLGEPSSSPLSGQIAPSPFEFVKLAGTDGSWSCLFFDPLQNGCTIYQHRPLECRLLQCSSPEELLEVIGRDTLTRRQLINSGDAVLAMIEQHEERCSFEECNRLIELCRQEGGQKERARLTELLGDDLELRRQALQEHGLSAGFELFIFGRPMFISVRQSGLDVVEKNGLLNVLP